jgi:hypothetical protein
VRRAVAVGALALGSLALLGSPCFAQEKSKGANLDLPRGVELPIRVRVSVWVASIAKIDEVEGTFTGEFDVHFRWRDARVAFDPAANQGVDRKEFGFDESGPILAALWTPGIQVSNMDKGGDDRVALTIDASGDVDVLHRINGRFKSPLDFSRFPFDAQKLFLELRSPKYPASQIVLTHDVADRQASGVNAGVVIPNWHFDKSLGFEVTVRRGWTGRDHSVAVASITARRETAQYFFQLFLPYFTIMMFPPLALWVPKAEVMPRANMTFSGLFSLIALSYSIFVRYPMLAAVDNVIVQLLWMGYVYMAFVLALIMTVHNPSVTNRFGGKHLWAEAVDYTTWSVPLLFALATCGTILHSM